MRVFTVVNAVLWLALFVMWLPYVSLFGLSDPVSQQVMLILGITAVLMAFLFGYRLSRRRPILG